MGTRERGFPHRILLLVSHDMKFVNLFLIFVYSILLRRRRGIEEEEHSIWQRILKIARPFEVIDLSSVDAMTL